MERWHCKECINPKSIELGVELSEKNCLYAIGLILLEIITDAAPFKDMNIGEVVKFVTEGGTPDLNGLMNKEGDEQVRSIITRILTKGKKNSFTLVTLKEELKHYLLTHPDNSLEESSISEEENNNDSDGDGDEEEEEEEE